jgi:hypothetical protein
MQAQPSLTSPLQFSSNAEPHSSALGSFCPWQGPYPSPSALHTWVPLWQTPTPIVLVHFVEQARDVARRPVQIVVAATKVGSSSRHAALAAIARQVGRKAVGFQR